MQTKGLTIRVLLADDNQDDYYLIRGLLSHIPVQNYELEWLRQRGLKPEMVDRMRAGTN